MTSGPSEEATTSATAVAVSSLLRRRNTPSAPATAAAPQIDLQIDLERGLQRLSPAEQAVLLHCSQLGLSQEEAAYVLAMPLGTVKSYIRRAFQQLQSSVKGAA